MEPIWQIETTPYSYKNSDSTGTGTIQTNCALSQSQAKLNTKFKRDMTLWWYSENDETLYPGKPGFQEGFRDGVGQTR